MEKWIERYWPHVFAAAIFLIAASLISHTAPLVEHRRDNHAEATSNANNGHQNAASLKPSQAENQQTADVGKHARHNKKEAGWFGIPFDGWVAIWTFFLFAATAGLFVFTGLLWRSTSVLVGDEQVYTKRELRAYVNVRKGAVVMGDVLLTVKNFGKTPAYKMMFWIQTEIRNKDDVPNFERPASKEFSAESVIPPNGRIKLSEKIEDVRTRNDRGHFDQGVIYAYGEIVYVDAFDTDQTTEFRYYRPSQLGGGPLMVHDSGNEST